MNVSAYIARRYLFSKKSHNVINIISLISVIGVATGTMALILVLSVMNGFDGLMKTVFSSFDPDLKITVTQGKVFDPDAEPFKKVASFDFVDEFCGTLEENVLLEYEGRMHAAVVKGVPDNFESLTAIDTKIIDGEYKLHDGRRQHAVIGNGVAYYLSVGLNFLSPIKLYVPKRTGKVSMNPKRAFNEDYIFPSGIFSIQQEIDVKYILVPIAFARNLLSYQTEVTAVELKLKPTMHPDKAKKLIEDTLGPNFVVKNQYQQHEVLYRVMKAEKFAIYLILTLILIVASFNIIGSISMLIIDKKDDINTLRSMGFSTLQIRHIFLIEGWMISIGGALTGLVIGALVVLGQMRFGWLKLDNMGTFLVSAYPVELQLTDFFMVFATVVVIGFGAAWYPVKYFTKRYLQQLS
jgi:lipoprotein-releasing system permease protein